jgi:hypothetical protein
MIHPLDEPCGGLKVGSGLIRRMVSASKSRIDEDFCVLRVPDPNVSIQAEIPRIGKAKHNSENRRWACLIWRKDSSRPQLLLGFL